MADAGVFVREESSSAFEVGEAMSDYAEGALGAFLEQLPVGLLALAFVVLLVGFGGWFERRRRRRYRKTHKGKLEPKDPNRPLPKTDIFEE